MTVFEPSEAGRHSLAARPWEGAVRIGVTAEGIRPERIDSDRGLVQLDVDQPEVGAQALSQLQSYLGNLAGVVPADAPRREHEIVVIPCVDPTEIGGRGLSWSVNEDLRVEWSGYSDSLVLRVAGNDDACAPFVAPSHHEYFGLVWLSAQDAWRLMRVLASVEAWVARVGSRRGRATVDLLDEARRALLAPPGRLFAPDQVVETWISVPERPGADFVLRGDRVETHDYAERQLMVSVELERAELTEAGLEALVEALGGVDLPYPLPLPLRVPLVEPRVVGLDASWWRVANDVWLVQRGFDSVSFCGADGTEPPGVLDLDGAEAWLLVRVLVSIQTLLRDARADAEAASIARRRRAMEGLPPAQAPSD